MSDATPLLARCFQQIAAGPGAGIRLVCFPFAGDALPRSAYQRWKRPLQDRAEIWAVRHPGRAERMGDPHPETVQDLVSELAKAITETAPAPTLFFGHSMGALIAFELARQLRGTAHAPARMVASGFFAPQSLVRSRHKEQESEAELLQRMERLGGTPVALFDDREMRELLVPAIRADFKACDGYIYRHEPPLDCPLTTMGGYSDPLVSGQDIDDWEEQTTADFRARMFPGNHFYLFAESSEPLVLWTLEQELRELRKLS